jgi:hypothetical protein
MGRSPKNRGNKRMRPAGNSLRTTSPTTVEDNSGSVADRGEGLEPFLNAEQIKKVLPGCPTIHYQIDKKIPNFT